MVDVSRGQAMPEIQTPLRDRPRLVRADAGDAADVLDGDGAADQRLVLPEAVDPDAEEEREDDGELLRDGGGGEGHRAHDRVEPAVPLPKPDTGEDQADDRGGHEQHRDEALNRRLQRGARARAAHRRADDLSIDRLAADERDPERRASGEQSSAGKGPVLGIHEGLVTRRAHRRRPLGDGVGLTGERRFVHLQVGAGDDDPVGGEGLARGDEGEIAGHHLGDRDLDRRPVTEDPRACRQPAEEPAGGGLGPPVEEGVHAD